MKAIPAFKGRTDLVRYAKQQPPVPRVEPLGLLEYGPEGFILQRTDQCPLYNFLTPRSEPKPRSEPQLGRNVGLDGGTLRVRRALTTAKGGPVLAAPKTKGSRRTVKLPPKASEALRGHPGRQPREIDAAGPHWRENGLMFASEAGEPLDRRYVTTHLSKNVNPKVLSEMLVHASIAITLDTYSHVLPDMQESAVRAMEEALS